MKAAHLKVLVVGGGGREHALAWKIATSPLVAEVICAPGNAGTEGCARNVDVAAEDVDGLVALARAESVGLVVVGPEGPLCAGLGDRLREAGFPVFGPNADGARLEGSKLFAKELLERHRIPTGAWRRFDRAGAAKSYLETLSTWPQVIKADGLAAGKGVFICTDAREACAVVDQVMEERSLGAAGAQVLIEEFLAGQEISIQALTDGHTILILDGVVDHKAVGDGDVGPNTGGMGVCSPAAFLTPRVLRQIEQRVLIPILHALRVEEIDYRGVLYAGLILTDAGPRVLEFNCRFGDPETQAVVRRFVDDLVPYLLACAEARLAELDPPDWDPRACVGVVAAAEGYPGGYRRGDPIRGLDAAGERADVVVFHAGTRRDGSDVLTAGGRVLCVTALGQDVDAARVAAYGGIDAIDWSGKFCRRDIGLPRRVAAAVGDPLGVAEGSRGGSDR
jgi:phosphoribosylamine--glycine ligase